MSTRREDFASWMRDIERRLRYQEKRPQEPPVVTQADLDALKARIDTLETPPIVSVGCTNATMQSIPSAAWTTVTGWNTAVRDSHTSWAAGNPSRLTCKRSGLYLVLATLPWASSATGARYAKVIRNGSAAFVLAPRQAQTTGTDGSAEPNFAQFVDLLSASYIELQVYQSSGGSLGIFGTSTDSVSGFSMHWLRS